MVDFTSSFSQPTDLQKKITNTLQSSKIISEKQNNLVIILFKFKTHIKCVIFN